MPARPHLLRPLATVVAAATLLALPGAAPALAADPQLVEVDSDASADLGAPYGLALAPDGDHLYAVGSAGSLVTFARAGNGSLTQVDADGLGGAGSNFLAVSPDGENVYVATPDSVVAFAVRRNGTVAVEDDISAPEVPSMVDPYGIDVSRDGRLVYVTDTGSPDGAVHVLRRNPRNGRLTFSSTYKPQAGAPGQVGEAYVVADSVDGRQVYVSRCGDGTLPGLLVLRRAGDDRLRLQQQRVLGSPGDAQCGWGIGPGSRSVVVADNTGDRVVSFVRSRQGSLRPADLLSDADIDDPYYLSRPGGGSTVFVESYVGGGIGRVAVDAQGDLRLRGFIEVGGPYGAAAADARNVYVSDYNGGNVVTLRRRD